MRARRTSAWVAALLALAATTITSGTVSAAPGGDAQPRGVAVEADRGTWRVEPVGDARYVVSWTSPTRLPLTSDRPRILGPAGVVVGPATIAADGRTVRATLAAPTAPDVADLTVVLSGDRLDAPGDDRVAARVGGAGRALDLPGTVTLPVDPGSQGPHEVVASDYELDPVKLPGMPETVEMVGHVVEPAPDAATGERPLVLFLHGRHGVCYDPADDDAFGDWPCRPPFREIPSHLGYDYIQRVLASQGFATVSVRVNGINAQDFRLLDGGADARAEIVERHLDHWATLADEHRLDLSRVVLVGHSRGGEGVDRASIQIPLSAPYRIAGQVLIAPTDFGSQTAPYVPTVTLLPFCDGDVFDLQGQRFTDTARDLTTDDTSLKSSVLVMGANHNFFNTEWTPGIAAAPSFDDWFGAPRAECGRQDADRLSAQEQQAVGTAYVAGAVRLFAEQEQELLPLFDGSRARVDSLVDAQALSHAIGGGRDVRRPGVDLALTPADGARTRLCQGRLDPGKVGSCAHRMELGMVAPHWPGGFEQVPTRSFFEMSWTTAGQSGGMLLDEPLDLSSERLELRTIVDPAAGDADLRVRITDATGGTALLAPVGAGRLPVLGGRDDTRKAWAQSLVADPSGAVGVDLTRVTRVDLVAQSPSGRVWVADVAAAPSALAAVPDVRMPTIDIRRVQVTEGDGREPRTVSVPFHVVGELTRAARLVVLTAGQTRGELQRFTVDLAPGQTSGSIPVTYRPDRFDDFPRMLTTVAAWPTRNVMTDAYLGALTVLDDDPTPKVTVKPVDRTVAEGQRATWLVRVAEPVDYHAFVSGTVVAGPAPRLSGGDVPLRWLKRFARSADPGKPLWKLKPGLFADLRAGRLTVAVSIPIRRDAVAEGRESVTVRIKTFGRTFRSTVHVAPSH